MTRIFTVIILTLCWGCGGALISPEQERKIGVDVHNEIKKEYKLVKPSSTLGKWAKNFTRPLRQASDRFRSLDEVDGYRVYVIADDKLINAFAAPGGFTYLSTGLILAADSCAEIAGVMGHELAHVTQKHGVKKLESTIAVQTAGEIVLGDGAGQQTASAIWAFFQNTTFSREDETEADLVGLQITKEGGYDPFGLANFFQKLVGGAQVPEFLSSHPASKKRVAAVRKSIRSRYGRKSKEGQLGSTKCKTPIKLGKLKKMIRNKRYQLLNP